MVTPYSATGKVQCPECGNEAVFSMKVGIIAMGTVACKCGFSHDFKLVIGDGEIPTLVGDVPVPEPAPVILAKTSKADYGTTKWYGKYTNKKGGKRSAGKNHARRFY